MDRWCAWNDKVFYLHFQFLGWCPLVLCLVSVTRICPTVEDNPEMAGPTCLHYIFHGSRGLQGRPWSQRSSWSVSWWTESAHTLDSSPTTCISPLLGHQEARSDQVFTISTAEGYHLFQFGFIFYGLGDQGLGNLLYKPKTEGYRCPSPWPLGSWLTSWRWICPCQEMNSFLGPVSAHKETIPEWPWTCWDHPKVYFLCP